MTDGGGTRYRREIDGLRALAVVSVVLYHADFSFAGRELFGGGFIGVDIFFVISGFLITRIMLNELMESRFSLLRFWERRARRILPAFFVVILATVPFGFLLLTNSAFVEYANSATGAILFVSNIFFWLQDSYTAQASQLKPLLHTWSLSVEEQYYLLAPASLWLVWRIKPDWIKPLIVLGIITSLFFAQFMSVKDSSANFYLLPSPGWELLSGSFLAVHFFHTETQSRQRWSLGLQRFFPTIGLLLIIGSIVLFDDQTPHPSFYTIIPILGVCLTIAFANETDPATRLLSTKPMVGIGLISYSFYLWHFPIFAFGRVAKGGHQTQADFALWIVSSCVLAWLTWKLVEGPFRNKNAIPIRTFAPAILVTGMLTIGVLQFFSLQAETDPFHHIPDTLHADFTEWSESSGERCIDQKDPFDVDGWCSLGASSKKIDFLLLGDSHALAQAGIFNTAAKQLGLKAKLINRSGCPLLIDLEPARGQPESSNCIQLGKQALSYAKEQDVKVVYLSARWNYYTCGAPQPDCGYTQNTRLFGGDWATSEEDRLNNLTSALEKTAIAFSEANIQLKLIAQVPHQPRDVKEIFSEYFQRPDQRNLSDMSVSYASHLKFTKSVRERLKRIAQAYPNVSLLDQSSHLCRDSVRCPAGLSDRSFYTDDNHISSAAFHLLKNWAIAELQPLGEP